jgi:farnesyl-diphosphate farnesyltransferase
LAYLLFRIADTLEDAQHVPARLRAAALRELRETVLTGNPATWQSLSNDWLSWRPSEHEGYLDLLRALPELLAAVRDLEPPAGSLILDHARRTMDGMSEHIASADGPEGLRLRSLDELRQYCYAVAGIVGELITELLVSDVVELEPAADALRRIAPWFGEGLQLVNILKDADEDAHRGRVFLPPGVPRESIFRLARADLARAKDYSQAVARCRPGQGILPFVQLPIRLAHGTLTRIERCGAGAKLTRREVAGILQQVQHL